MTAIALADLQFGEAYWVVFHGLEEPDVGRCRLNTFSGQKCIDFTFGGDHAAQMDQRAPLLVFDSVKFYRTSTEAYRDFIGRLDDFIQEAEDELEDLNRRRQEAYDAMTMLEPPYSDPANTPCAGHTG